MLILTYCWLSKIMYKKWSINAYDYFKVILNSKA